MSVDHSSFYIGGQWTAPSSSKRFTLVDASTEEPLGSVPEAVETDVDRVVIAAREAFDHSGWATCPGAERAAMRTYFTMPRAWSKSTAACTHASTVAACGWSVSSGFSGGS